MMGGREIVVLVDDRILDIVHQCLALRTLLNTSKNVHTARVEKGRQALADTESWSRFSGP